MLQLRCSHATQVFEFRPRATTMEPMTRLARSQMAPIKVQLPGGRSSLQSSPDPARNNQPYAARPDTKRPKFRENTEKQHVNQTAPDRLDSHSRRTNLPPTEPQRHDL